MARTQRGIRRVAWLACILAVFLITPAAIAQEIEPGRNILVPWFEVDLAHPDDGLDTLFTVVNASPYALTVEATVYTNWGIPVLHCSNDFKPTESHSCNLERWIVHGELPSHQLTPAEIADVQAKLSGQRSPVDNLYYATEVVPDVATGYVIFSVVQNEHVTSLWGDVYKINTLSNNFEADTLVRLDANKEADCTRHGIRFVNEGDLLDGTEIIVWTGRRFDPSPTTEPIGEKVLVQLAAFDMEGNHVTDCEHSVTAVEILHPENLGVLPPVGWFDITTATKSFISQHLQTVTDTTAAQHAWCLPEDLNLEGPSIHLKKFVAGHDADEPREAVEIPIGDAVSYTYKLTNTGKTALSSIVVTDSTGIAVSCPRTDLAVGESMTCTAHTTAVPCLNFNMGEVFAIAPDGGMVSDKDRAFYFGLYDGAALTIEKRVNGDDADTPTGPQIEVDETIQWSFVVTNTGDADLHNVKIKDTKVPHVSCPKTDLAPGESMTCTATTKAEAGQQDNVATASAYPPCGDPIEASDPAHYFGFKREPSIDIVKLVNGNDANSEPGLSVPIGTSLTWTFLVTNTGDTTLTEINVNDYTGLKVTCPKTTLEPGESMTCTAGPAPALPCQQNNQAEASGKPPKGGRVHDEDGAYYFGTPAPALSLETRVNGNDADTPPGPTLNSGDALTFTYIVTNTGDIELTGVTLTATDDIDFTPVCPKTTLAPGESMTCTATATASSGLHEHLASVTGTPECGDKPSANDPAYYKVLAGDARIDLEKLLDYSPQKDFSVESNSFDAGPYDADTAPGPQVVIGAAIKYQFVVTNTGNVPLTNIILTDDQLGTITCPQTSLDPSASMTCIVEAFAGACQHENHATVVGTAASIAPDHTVTDTDPLFYIGMPLNAIGFEKLTNGEHADVATGPTILVGSTVLWTYVVTNTSNVAITGVLVTDDRGVTVTCPKTSLEPGESMTCTASGTATRGQYRNTGSVSAKLPCGDPLSATDVSHYLGVLPLIGLEKLVAGEDADTAPGPTLKTGDPVLFSYVVTNTGDVTLTNVHVNDDHGLTVTCPKTTLAVAESMTCTATSTVTSGAYSNLGTAYGDALTTTVSATDPANYTGTIASVTIVKSTNGSDANTPPGPNINEGQAVQWTYVVTNTGTVTLTNVAVTDDKGVAVTCPKTTLLAAESMTCTASGTAVPGQYANIGTVTGTPPTGPNVTASDPSHYFGVEVADQGCTPGYWKNHTDSWPPTGYSTSQLVKSVFTEGWRYPAGWSTLLEALALSGGSGVNGAAEILSRAAVAALLNAAHPAVDYPRSPADVITDVNAAFASYDRDTMLALAAALDADNNLGCPLN